MTKLKDILYWIRNPERDIVKSISTRAKWSALTRVGNSNVVRLTIAAPFVGALLIFNRHILEVFDYSDRFLSDINKTTGSDVMSDYALGNLYYIYFGLFTIGIGSIIYSIFCPENVSRFPFSDEYNRSRVGLSSPTLCVSSFENVVESYARDFGELTWRTKNRRDELAYSDELGRLTYALLLRMHGAWNWDFLDDPENAGHASPRTNDIAEGASIEEESFSRGDITDAYIMATGYINISEMAKDIVSSPRVIWPIIMPFKDSSFSYQSDAYHLQYMIDDLSKPYHRISCAVSYTAGFIILFVPSAETFLRVIGYVFLSI